MFSLLRYNMTLTTRLAKAEPGLPRFSWNNERTVITIDCTAVPLKDIRKMIHSQIARMGVLVKALFRGCNYEDILSKIDDKLHPDHVKDWFVDNPQNRTIGFSFLSLPANGLIEFKDRLTQHLLRDEDLFVAGKAKTGILYCCLHDVHVLSDLN